MPARYARAIALYRTGALGSALLTIDGLLKEYPNDPYFHELRGQMLFENGRAAESVPSYRRAVQLLPGVGIVKIDFARALLETNKPDNDREAVRNLELGGADRIGQLRSVAADGGGLFQAQQSRHDLARARRDGDPSRQPLRGAGPRRRRRAAAAGRHAGLAARPGHQGLYQFAAPQEVNPSLGVTSMRSILLILCGGLIAVGLVLAGRGDRARPRRLVAPRRLHRRQGGAGQERSANT